MNLVNKWKTITILVLLGIIVLYGLGWFYFPPSVTCLLIKAIIAITVMRSFEVEVKKENGRLDFKFKLLF